MVLVRGNHTQSTSNHSNHSPPEDIREEVTGEGSGQPPDHPAQIAPPRLSVETTRLCLTLKTFLQHSSGILGGMLARMIANSTTPGGLRSTGYFWDGMYYIDTCLPFGVRYVPFLFNHYADALHWVIATNYHISAVLPG